MSTDNQGSPLLWSIVGLVALCILYFLYRMSHNVIVYRFYRPSCKYCVESQDEWMKFKMNEPLNLDYRIIDVNLDDKANQKLALRYNIATVPTVVRIDQNTGEYSVHTGVRSADNFKQFMMTGEKPVNKIK